VILVDTSVWIDFFRGKETEKTTLLELALEKDRIVIGDVILLELYQGVKNKKEEAILDDLVSLLLYKNMLGKEIALKAAENYRYLQSKGITVRKTIDVVIGTFCIEEGIQLLHDDRDFAPMVDYLGLIEVA
jgi:predicted nucleic acid-binding protein